MLQFFVFSALKGDDACIYYLLLYIYIYIYILPFDNEQCNYKIEIIILKKNLYILFFYYYRNFINSFKII